MASAALSLEILAALGRPHRLRDLGARAGLSYPQTYRAIHDLEGRGLLRLRRKGGELLVEAAEPRLVRLAREVLAKESGRDWGAALHGDRPTLLHVLDRVGSPGLAADVLGVSRAGVHKAIQAWASLGLLRRVGVRHALADGQGRLRAFLAEASRVEAVHRLRAIDPAGDLRWSLGPELLYWAPRPSASARVQPAGPTALAQYGITTFGRGAYHALSHRALDGADAALQTLLVGEGDALLRSTAALLVEKESLDLRRKAALYGLEEEARGVALYLAEQRDRAGFLPWPEYDGLRRLYGPAPTAAG